MSKKINTIPVVVIEGMIDPLDRRTGVYEATWNALIGCGEYKALQSEYKTRTEFVQGIKPIIAASLKISQLILIGTALHPGHDEYLFVNSDDVDDNWFKRLQDERAELDQRIQRLSEFIDHWATDGDIQVKSYTSLHVYNTQLMTMKYLRKILDTRINNEHLHYNDIRDLLEEITKQ